MAPPFPDGIERVVVGMGCFWGAERLFWQAPGRLHHRRRLRGRDHAEPDLRGDVLRPHRAHRGRARRLRPRADELRGAAPHLLGGPRPDPGHAPGQRRRHAVPLGDLLARRARSATLAVASRDMYEAELRGAGYGGDHDRASPRPARSTTPRTTTSSTSRRTRTATAGSAAPASRARSARASLPSLSTRRGRRRRPRARSSVVAAPPASRWAMYTGMIDATITNSATTLTIGSCAGRERVAKIQIGQRLLGARREDRDDDLVEREREREQPARQERRAHLREHHVPERLPVVGAEVGGRLVERPGRPAHARDHVVVDDDHAERRVADDDRREPERDAERAEHVDDRRLQREPGDDARAARSGGSPRT